MFKYLWGNLSKQLIQLNILEISLGIPTFTSKTTLKVTLNVFPTEKMCKNKLFWTIWSFYHIVELKKFRTKYITLVTVFCFATVTQQTNHWFIFIFVFLKSFFDLHCSQHILIDYVLSRLNNSIMNSILNMRNVQISKMCQKAKNLVLFGVWLITSDERIHREYYIA